MANEVVVKVGSILKSESVQERLRSMLDKNAEAFSTSILNVINGSQALQACEPATIVKSAMIAASLNLAIDPNLGFAAIVPYKNKGKSEAQFQMMWKGFVQLAIRSGQYETINVTEVYKDELLNYNPFTGEVEFTNSDTWKMRYENEGEVVGYYGYFKLLTGFKKASYMTVAEVEKHAMTYSQSYKNDKKMGYQSSRWSQDFDAMGKKTVLKLLLSKFGMLSIEMQKATTFDQAKITGTIENPEVAYVDSPDYEEKEEITNPFDKKNVDSVPFSEEPNDIDSDELPDFMKG